ncbi:MAG: hypothetical protein WCL71_02285 [Deltaproteobacteria bacterium]
MRILRDAFDDCDLPFQVDLVEWAGTSAEFKKVIENTAVSLKNPQGYSGDTIPISI